MLRERVTIRGMGDERVDGDDYYDVQGWGGGGGRAFSPAIAAGLAACQVRRELQPVHTLSPVQCEKPRVGERVTVTLSER